jgi:Peptidase family S41/N-terminal domain of Peptidase_S41 in eukaryotic IRBP
MRFQIDPSRRARARRLERGFLPRLRLWLDVTLDLATSVLRGYDWASYGFAAAQLPNGAPAFQLIAPAMPRPGALMMGAALSLVTFVVFFAIVSTGASARLPLLSGAEPNATDHQRVIRAVRVALKQYYVDRALGAKMAEAIERHEEVGDYDTIADGAALARLLTMQIRDISQDLHLEVIFSRRRLPSSPAGALLPEENAPYRVTMEQRNCTFEKTEILSHHIGYVKLDSFPHPSVCRVTAAREMARLNTAEAIIFDLRDNSGGFPDMVMLLAAYLFDRPEYIYNPRENTTERNWTQSPVAGSSLAKKPVFVLTSGRTMSAAEHFTWNMKMLKRATIVGERTAGAVHSGVFHRIDNHFGIAITEVRPINPFAETDWAITGVEPDVNVPAVEALTTATKLAESKITATQK